MGTKWTPGPWKMDDEGLSVWAKDTTMKICDIRGWGHLTGKGSGALGLSDEEGEAIQRANGALIEAAPRLYDELERTREVVQALIDDGYTAYIARRERIDAALAKARGDVPGE